LADSGIPEEQSETEVITYTRKKASGKREADLRGLETIEEPATELPEEKLRGEYAKISVNRISCDKIYA